MSKIEYISNGAWIHYSSVVGCEEKRGSFMATSHLRLDKAKKLAGFLAKDVGMEETQVDISRPSVAHGVARVEDYTKIKALQAILILDQMYSFLT